MENEQASTVQRAEIIQVIHIREFRGVGTAKDRCRLVDQYWTTDGRLLAECGGVRQLEPLVCFSSSSLVSFAIRLRAC